MDYDCMERIALYGSVCALENGTDTTVFGNITLDKLILSYLPVAEWMKMTQLSKAYRYRVWFFLWKYPCSHYQIINKQWHAVWFGQSPIIVSKPARPMDIETIMNTSD
jgi:hypothetical protein